MRYNSNFVFQTLCHEGLHSKQEPTLRARRTVTLQCNEWKHVEETLHRINTQCRAATTTMSLTLNPSANCGSTTNAITRIIHETLLPIDGYGCKSAAIEIVLVTKKENNNQRTGELHSETIQNQLPTWKNLWTQVQVCRALFRSNNRRREGKQDRQDDSNTVGIYKNSQPNETGRPDKARVAGNNQLTKPFICPKGSPGSY